MIKKHYCICLVNRATGEIDHIAVSDLPLADDLVGRPDNSAVTHNLKRVEFDADTGTQTLVRARETLSNLEMRGASAAARGAINAEVGIRQGTSKLLNLFVSNQHVI